MTLLPAHREAPAVFARGNPGENSPWPRESVHVKGWRRRTRWRGSTGIDRNRRAVDGARFHRCWSLLETRIVTRQSRPGAGIGQEPIGPGAAAAFPDKPYLAGVLAAKADEARRRSPRRGGAADLPDRSTVRGAAGNPSPKLAVTIDTDIHEDIRLWYAINCTPCL
jgi:hypothetical protein